MGYKVVCIKECKIGHMEIPIYVNDYPAYIGVVYDGLTPGFLDYPFLK
jgi:hypothetical protein